MPLVIHIKPGESVFIGRGAITNKGTYRTYLEIQGDIPILHEKEMLRQEDVDSPCKSLYFTIQTMYLSGDAQTLHDTYTALLRDIEQAMPSAAPRLKIITEELHATRYHKALKEARRLFEDESTLPTNR